MLSAPAAAEAAAAPEVVLPDDAQLREDALAILHNSNLEQLSIKLLMGQLAEKYQVGGGAGGGGSSRGVAAAARAATAPRRAAGMHTAA
jgi:hypothetical protein